MRTMHAKETAGAWLVVGLTLLGLIPFLDKPFAIDDPVFLWSAEQIARNPFDFYGAPINWYGFEQPLSAIATNPPLVPYGIAAVFSLAGSSERVLHTAFLIPAAAAVLGTWSLAGCLGAPPTVAALAVLASPVFLTSASSVMCDVTMLAFATWALVLWIRGLEQRRSGALFAAGGLVAAAALTKYFGLAFVPLLALFALWRERRAGLWCLALAVPVLVAAAYQWTTHALYGQGLVSYVADYAVTTRAETSRGLGRAVFVGLGFTGASAATLLFYLPSLASGWRWRVGGVAGVVALAAVLPGLGTLGGQPLRADGAVRWELVLQIALHAAVGCAVLALALADFARRRGPDSALLLAWVLGTFAFASYVNWTTNARSILPMMPAVGILIGRSLAARGAGRWARFLPLAPAAVLAFVVASEDRRMAENAKHAADLLHAKLGAATDAVWFQGHWGFQYYMQVYGFRPLDRLHADLKVGDVIVSPLGNSGILRLPGRLRTVERLVAPPSFVAVMDRHAGAGFYSSIFGPLPYTFGGAQPEETLIERVTQRTALRSEE